MSFVVAQMLQDAYKLYGPLRHYELADGSLSMDPVRHDNGISIYSAEKLLVDIERHLNTAHSTKRVILYRCAYLDEKVSE